MDTSEKTLSPKLHKHEQIRLTVDNVVSAPMNMAELEAIAANGRICVCVALALGQLIDTWGVDGLNDVVEEHICDGGVFLEDISCTPVCVDLVTKKIIIEVDAAIAAD